MTDFDFSLLLDSQEHANANLEQANLILLVILIFVAANLGAQLIRNLRK